MRLFPILGALLVGGAMAASGCRDDGPPPQKEPAAAPGKRPVDSTLVAFLSKARAAHHYADLAEARGERSQAIAFVRRITEGDKPAMTPEVVEVVADAHARLGELLAAEEAFDEAVEEVMSGLELAREPTHFRGHLFEVWGVIEHGRMEALEAERDFLGAEEARQTALWALEEAITIQEGVVERAIPEP